MMRPLGPDRDRLLDSAETLFAAHGYDAVSLRAVSIAAGSTQSLLHYHFDGKLDLYRAIWRRWADLPRPLKIPKDAAPLKNRRAHIADVVEDFFRGPKYLSSTESGRRFLKILIREFSDPKASDRGLLKEFFEQDRVAFIKRISSDPISIDIKNASAIFKILGSTVQAFANPNQLSENSDDLVNFDILMEFAVGGICSFIREIKG